MLTTLTPEHARRARILYQCTRQNGASKTTPSTDPERAEVALSGQIAVCRHAARGQRIHRNTRWVEGLAFLDLVRRRVVSFNPEQDEYDGQALQWRNAQPVKQERIQASTRMQHNCRLAT